MRRTLRCLDSTKAPHKKYKYSYMPDPRKLSPIEISHHRELDVKAIRPPTKYVPDKDTFLEKCDIKSSIPTSDFKSSFDDWKDLMTTNHRKMKANGIPKRTATFILKSIREFNGGIPPERFDGKEEEQYWKQFKTGDGQHKRIPELPEKYRPHQMGQDAPSQLNLKELNEPPQWVAKEEEKLKNNM